MEVRAKQGCYRKKRLNPAGKILVIMLSLFIVGCRHQTASDPQRDPEVSGQKPDYARAAKIYTELGLGYLAQEQVIRAKDKLTSALKYGPKDAGVMTAWGIYSEHVGDLKEARMYHEKAVQYAKGEQVGSVQDAYGSFLCRQGDWPAAKQAFERAWSDRKSLKLAYFYESAGLCAAETHHEVEAEAYLTKALQMDSQRALAALALAQLKIKQHAFQEASQWLLQYGKHGPQTARSTLMALQVAKGLGQQDQAANLELLFTRSYHDTPEFQEYRQSSLKEKK